jgi:hypothetical protein
MARRPAQNNSPVSRDEVAREAFRIFQSRNGAPGDPVADWFQAEQAVRSRTPTRTPANAPRSNQAEAAAGSRGSNRRNRRGNRR